jgi:hypothetical protein
MALWHLILILIVLLLLVLPIWRILKRLGLSPWLSLLYLVPLVNLICLWVLAYTRWPNVIERRDPRLENAKSN